MSEIALARIKGFGAGSNPADFVPTLTLTIDQLRELVDDLKDTIENCNSCIAQQNEKITRLEAEIKDINATQEVHAENDLNQLRLIADLKTAAPTKKLVLPGEKTKARIDKIDEILKTRGSTTLKELGRILKIRPQEMSRIVSRLDKRRYEMFPRAGERREKVLRLKVQIS